MLLHRGSVLFHFGLFMGIGSIPDSFKRSNCNNEKHKALGMNEQVVRDEAVTASLNF